MQKSPIVWCSDRPRIETRQDKYGQCIRLVCRCGVATNWHTERWMADTALNQIKHNGVLRG
jgi:hypothetical protein